MPRAAKLERGRIMERTARGRADAESDGIKLGCKPSLTRINSKRRASGSMRRDERSVARSYNISPGDDFTAEFFNCIEKRFCCTFAGRALGR
jgi:hypothetical protein